MNFYGQIFVKLKSNSLLILLTNNVENEKKGVETLSLKNLTNSEYAQKREKNR